MITDAVDKWDGSLDSSFFDQYQQKRRVEWNMLTLDEKIDRFMPQKTLLVDDKTVLAMDSANFAHLGHGCGLRTLLGHAIGLGYDEFEIAPQFLGYAYLAGLSQNALIRAGVCTMADDMTRRFEEFKYNGEVTENNDAINAIADTYKEFRIRDIFNNCAQKSDFDGGCLVYIDVAMQSRPGPERDKELLTPLRLGRGDLRGFKVVDALNIYPGNYNAADPLADDYFAPTTWLVLGKEIHKSRFLYFSPNELNFLIRPAYNFFGLPKAQEVLDYCAHFTKDRESAKRLLNKFSLIVFKGDAVSLARDKQLYDKRMAFFTQTRSNDGTLFVDKATEDVMSLSVPLTGTVEHVRQDLEFIAAIFRMPVTKLLGISPAGLNATGQYDEVSYNTHLESKREKMMLHNHHRVCQIIQLHLFGEVDPRISAEFQSISDEDKVQKAEINLLTSREMIGLVGAGIIHPHEARKALADDKHGKYSFIDPDDVPEQMMNDANYSGGYNSAGQGLRLGTSIGSLSRDESVAQDEYITDRVKKNASPQ